MADGCKDLEEFVHDARVQHIAAVSSTLLQHSRECLQSVLQKDASARQCLATFLDGTGKCFRRALPPFLPVYWLCSELLCCCCHWHAGSSALLVCLEKDASSDLLPSSPE